VNNWEVIGSSGFSDLRVEDVRMTVRERFGEYRTSRRASAALETDHFPASGLLVTYGSDERSVSFIEVTPPASPTIGGVGLIGRPLDDVVADLSASRTRIIPDQDGAMVEGWDIGLYASAGTVEAVSAGQ
jgi:hypothetical protein